MRIPAKHSTRRTPQYRRTLPIPTPGKRSPAKERGKGEEKDTALSLVSSYCYGDWCTASWRSSNHPHPPTFLRTVETQLKRRTFLLS